MNTIRHLTPSSVLAEVEGLTVRIGFGVKNLGAVHGAMMEEIIDKGEAGEALYCCYEFLANAYKELADYLSASFDALKAQRGE